MDHVMIHPTALVDPRAEIGAGTRIWMNAQVREGARLGRGCIIGKDAYIDFQVVLGDYCKVQNGALIYHMATLGEGVFVGPGAILTNDRVPRALNPDGTQASASDWHAGHIRLGRGVSIGAGAVLLTDLTLGEFALVGAGSVVTHDVPAYTLAVGNPARRIGYVCKCGRRLNESVDDQLAPRSWRGLEPIWICPHDGLRYRRAGEGLEPTI